MIMEINLYMKLKTKKGLEFFIDEQDKKLVSKKVWRIDHGYVRSGTNCYLHRYLLNFPKNKIDHIDGNPLNNCRSNLRICTQQENLWNMKKRKNTSSKFKGVSWSKKDKVWCAHITKDYKSYHLGSFKTEIEASKIYNNKALEIFGNF